METDPPSAGDPPGITMVLYVTRPVAGDRTETIDRLNSLNVDGAIDSFEVRTVEPEVIVSAGSDQDPEPRLEDLETFAAWSGSVVRADFDVKEDCTRTGRTVRTCAPPAITLAVHAGGTLVCVFPCTDGDRTWSVVDFLDSYEDTRELPEGIGIDLGAV